MSVTYEQWIEALEPSRVPEANEIEKGARPPNGTRLLGSRGRVPSAG